MVASAETNTKKQQHQLPPFPVSQSRQELINSKRLKKTATLPIFTNKIDDKAVVNDKEDSHNKSKPGVGLARLSRNKPMKDLLTQFKSQNISSSSQNLGGASGFKINMLKDDEAISLRSSFSTKNKLQQSHPKLKNLTLQIGGGSNGHTMEGGSAAYISGVTTYNPMPSARN